jgi:hypothetical protein
VIPVQVKTEGVTPQGQRATRQVPVSMWFHRSGFSEETPPPFMNMDASGKPETLAVRNLEPGSYWMEASVNSPWYVQSVQCGDIDLLRDTLTLGTDLPCAAIDVVLRDDGASLSVSQASEGEATQGTVLLVPEKAPLQTRVIPLANHATTASLDPSTTIVSNEAPVASGFSGATSALPANSSTELNDLPPGQYSVLLLDRVDDLEYKNPEVMSAYMSKAVHVTLEPNQKASVSVELIHVEHQ